MLKKIFFCLLLAWVTCVLFLEVSIIFRDVLFKETSGEQIKILKKISFYSYNS